jgi:photosystem II stability/assembly factor-like uncharacterized protein
LVGSSGSRAGPATSTSSRRVSSSVRLYPFNAWRAQPLPFAADGSALDLEAHQAGLWLLGTRRSDFPFRDALARSQDAGQTFRTGAGPCTPGLGGELASTSASDVWAVCPTGMLAGAWRSTNGGISFARLRTPQLVNSAQLAPSADVAILARGGNTRLLRTTDGGKTWTAPKTPGRLAYVLFVGFSDARVGAAVVQIRGETTALWRTADGGATWARVKLP